MSRCASTRCWHTAYVALGSNLGDKEGYLRGALAGFEADENIRLKTSSFITTAPMAGWSRTTF